MKVLRFTSVALFAFTVDAKHADSKLRRQTPMRSASKNLCHDMTNYKLNSAEFTENKADLKGSYITFLSQNVTYFLELSLDRSLWNKFPSK